MSSRTSKFTVAGTAAASPPHLRAELARQRTRYVKSIASLLAIDHRDAELALVAARMAASLEQDKQVALPEWAFLQLPDLFERFADGMLMETEWPEVPSGDFDAGDPACADLVDRLRRDRGLAHILDTAANRGQMGAHVVLSVAYDQARERRTAAQRTGIC